MKLHNSPPRHAHLAKHFSLHLNAARRQAHAVALVGLLIVLGLFGWCPMAGAAGTPETLPATPGRPAALEPSVVQPVTITDVVAMSRSGLDDQVIINLIRQNGMASSLSTAELISLRQHGISNTVIATMQSAAPPVQSAAPTEVIRVYETPRPPVVIQSYVVPRPYVVTRPYYYPSYQLRLGHVTHGHHGHPGHHGHHGPPRSGGKTSFGFGITWR